jgi:dsDNA-specific endonuclease/ATPase MutS2
MTCGDTISHEKSPTGEPDTVLLPIEGILDLHTFHPREVKDLVREYLRACCEKGIFDVRIIHGKGTGTLRRTVEAALRSMPEVRSFRLAGEEEGGWGATIATLAPKPLGEGPAGKTTGHGQVTERDQPGKE